MGVDGLRMKVVGRRRYQKDRTDWKDVARLLRTARALIGSWRCAPGVYRFSSFEEADEWMMRMMIDKRVRPKSKTSPGSPAR